MFLFKRKAGGSWVGKIASDKAQFLPPFPPFYLKNIYIKKNKKQTNV